MTLKLIKDELGNPLELIGTWQDITKQKLAEEALKRRENAYRTLAENLPASVYRLYLRERGKMEFFNNVIEQITGYTKDELRKGEICSIDPFISPEDKPHVMEVVNNAIKNKSAFEVEYRFKSKDGHLSHFYEKGIPISGEDGKPLYIDGVIFDFTDRKLAEMKLKESEENYRTLFKNVPIGIGITDLTGNIVTFNDSILEPGGYSRDDLIRIGKVENIYYNLSDRETLIPLLKEKGTITQHPIKFKRKDGSPYDTLLTLSIIYINDRPMIQAVVEDITERKLAEETLKKRENSYRTLSENLPASVYRLYLRERGRMEFFNNVLEQISGYTKDELRKGEYLFY